MASPPSDSGEVVDRYRDRRDGAPLRDLGVRLRTWVGAHVHELCDAEPDMPVEDRAADTWEPLIAIGDLAGGDWPARARKAAIALTAEDDTDTTLGARLLADLRDLFGDAEAMHGEAILTGLHKISEAPWGDYFGHPMNARDMPGCSGPYGIRVEVGHVKIDGINRRYRRASWPRWSRAARPEAGLRYHAGNARVAGRVADSSATRATSPPRPGCRRSACATQWTRCQPAGAPRRTARQLLP